MSMKNYKTNRFLYTIPLLMFLCGGTFFLFHYLDYIFFYQEKSILFEMSLNYLFEHLNQPGGFLQYLGKLQATFYYYPLLGALIISVQICGIVLIFQQIGRKMTGRTQYIFPYLLGALLFYLQTNYQYLALNNLGVLLQLVLFYVFIGTCGAKCLWIAVVFSPVFYFLLGSYSVLIVLLLSFWMIVKAEWKKLSLMLVFISGSFLIGHEWLFFQTTKTLLVYPYRPQDVGGQVPVFFVTMVLLSATPLLFKLDISRLKSGFLKKTNLVRLSPFAVLIALAFMAVSQIDKKNSHYFHVEKLFYEKKYDELIRYNRQYPSDNILTAFFTNVALAETGQLSDSFFNYRQKGDGGTLFLKWEIVSEVLKRGGYFYYAVGIINEAQRWAYEYMVMQGNSPEVIKMLIKTDLIKGKHELAEKYVEILEKSVFYKKDAREFRAMIHNSNKVANHKELGRMQKLDVKRDFFVQANTPAVNLDYILEADSTNMAAIEYKLAWLMLTKDMQGVVNMLPVMEKAGYTRLPKNVEEVVATYQLLKVGEMPELTYLTVSRQTKLRFQEFYKIFQQNQGSKSLAQRALTKNFAHTYWYYVFFN